MTAAKQSLWRVERKSDGDSWFAQSSVFNSEASARRYLAEVRDYYEGSAFRLVRKPVVQWEVVVDA